MEGRDEEGASGSPLTERKREGRLKSVFLVAAAISRLKKPAKRPSSLDLSACSNARYVLRLCLVVAYVSLGTVAYNVFVALYSIYSSYI